MWLRSFLISFVIHIDLHKYIPEVRLAWSRRVFKNILQRTASVVSAVTVAAVSGVFPVPFLNAVVYPMYTVLSVLIRILFLRQTLYDQLQPTASATIRDQLHRVTKLTTFGVFLLNVYSFSAAFFARLPSEYQVFMTTYFQGLKVWSARRIWNRAQIFKGGTDDLAAVQVAFASRFFHVLFTSTCLRTSKSTFTLAVFIVMSTAEDALLRRALRDQVNRANRITRQCGGGLTGLALLRRLSAGLRHTRGLASEARCASSVKWTTSTPLGSSLMSSGVLRAPL